MKKENKNKETGRRNFIKSAGAAVMSFLFLLGAAPVRSIPEMPEPADGRDDDIFITGGKWSIPH